MRSLRAIAGLTLRSAIRSKVVLCLLVLLAIAIIGLPLTVKDDGTLGGKVQIVISYSLRTAQAILAIATVWLGAAAVSGEVKDRTIQLVVTKPVSRGTIWAGKWLGLLLLNGGLLIVSVLSVSAVLHWRLKPNQLPAEQKELLYRDILVARAEIDPLPVDLSEAVNQRMAEETKGKEQTARELKSLRANLTREVQYRANTVPPGAVRTWEFLLPYPASDAHPVSMQWTLRAMSMDKPDMMGLWLLGPDPSTGQQMQSVSIPGSRNTRPIPINVIGTNQQVKLAYANVHPEPVPALFDPDEGVLLMQRVGGFAPNMIRTAAILFAQLAFISAVALTCGSLFSLPVATFVSLSLLFLQLFGGMVREVSDSGTVIQGQSPAAQAADKVMVGAYKALAVFLTPAAEEDPLHRLATGRLVAGSEVVRAVGIRIGMMAGLFALISIYLFNKREIGKPQ